jgi:hypothetical protein
MMNSTSFERETHVCYKLKGGFERANGDTRVVDFKSKMPTIAHWIHPLVEMREVSDWSVKGGRAD